MEVRPLAIQFPFSSSALCSHQTKRHANNLTDTLWASGYEVYDRFSKPFQSFLESLTATYSQAKAMHDKARSMGQSLEQGPRGAPANVGSVLEAVHPVVRTHPVTGWKSVYAMGLHCKKINGLSPLESQFLLDRIYSMISENHDLQVRFRWQNPSDIGKLQFPTPSLYNDFFLPSFITKRKSIFSLNYPFLGG